MITFENVTRTYRTKRGDINALDSVTTTVTEGSFTVLEGPSGSGKTTLLLAAAGMLRPTSGKVLVAGKDIYAMPSAQRAAYRAQNIGFVFQMFHLVPYLNIIENVLLAAGVARKAHPQKRAIEVLTQLGLENRMTHRPAQLSAGEKQRVAIARAVFNDPGIILADEPTGNLDPENGKKVLTHLAQFNKKGTTILIVTHGPEAKQFATNTIQMQNGTILQNT